MHYSHGTITAGPIVGFVAIVRFSARIAQYPPPPPPPPPGLVSALLPRVNCAKGERRTVHRARAPAVRPATSLNPTRMKPQTPDALQDLVHIGVCWLTAVPSVEVAAGLAIVDTVGGSTLAEDLGVMLRHAPPMWSTPARLSAARLSLQSLHH